MIYFQSFLQSALVWTGIGSSNKLASTVTFYSLSARCLHLYLTSSVNSSHSSFGPMRYLSRFLTDKISCLYHRWEVGRMDVRHYTPVCWLRIWPDHRVRLGRIVASLAWNGSTQLLVKLPHSPPEVRPQE